MSFRPFLVVLILGLGLLPEQGSAQNFKNEQLRHVRVREAFADKETVLKRFFETKGIQYPPRRILIRIFKEERILELWVANSDKDRFQLLKKYEICASSGELGPKRQQGDGQVPEGFYHVTGFNPQSAFYLSLRIDYPNRSDSILGTRGRLGGDIFIHGSCVTIGCIPIEDDKIKELYLMAVEARSAGQVNMPVHIFPVRLTEEGFRQLERDFAGRTDLLNFWKNLRMGFDYFEGQQKPPVVGVDSLGEYIFPN